MNYLQKVFLFMCLFTFLTSAGKTDEHISKLTFPYKQFNYKGICEDVIIDDLNTYGEQTVFYDFYMNFTEKD